MPTWRNWAGSVRVSPSRLTRPNSVAEIQTIIRSARPGSRIRMTGSGHSFTPIAVTRDVLLQPSDFGDGVGIDSKRLVARIPAGMTLSEVNEHLALAGFALINMGDITAQTMAGSISTSTHGTGLAFTGLAGQVEGFGLVTADGNHMDCSASEHPDVWRLGRVALGALGILTYVDMRIVPTFRLHAVEEPRRLDDVLSNFDRIITSTDHFEFYWIPHTRWALTKTNTRTQDQAQPRPRVGRWWNKTVMENYAFGAVCAAGRVAPSLIPRLATALPSSGRQEFTEASYTVFATRRLVKFHEMEYSIPRQHLVTALQHVVDAVERSNLKISFPVEVRVTGPDDVPLSTSFGRESAYIAVHMYKGMPYERYFRMVEEILSTFEGRPHWGKIHFQSAETLRSRYEHFDAFREIRERLDPNGVFLNEYVERVLGA
jgi:FAD-linked oxidoreductase